MLITLYDIVVVFFGFVLDTFFREIKSRGSHKIPEEGPLIFVAAPHANQFVDPLILMRNSKRPISFLIAEKSMKRKYVGTIARSLHAIPVIRPQDSGVPGKGKIYLSDRKNEPLLISGIGTKFTEQLKVGGQISLPNDRGSSEVTDIISDTKLKIKKEFKDLKALEMLTQPEGTTYNCLPHIDQSKVYQAVFEVLNAGGCVGIFPEGGSHDRTEILPLKAGVTIMALGAMAANSKLNVKIVPCGLNYFHAHQFRSRAVVEFGSPILIPRELVEKYRKGGQNKRDACSDLLGIIYNGLKTVTVNTPDYETLMVIQAARRLYRPEHHKLELPEVMELNRRFVGGYMNFKDDLRVQQMNKEVMVYNQQLKNYGLKDHQVQKTAYGGFRALFLLLHRIFLLILWSILGFPGMILGFPIMVIARVISAKKAKEAVKSSSVKVKGRDVLATWKLLVALGVTPIFYGIYTLIILVIAYNNNWRFILNFGILSPIVVFIILSVITYGTMRLADTGLDIYRSLRPLFLSLLPWSKSSIQNLRQIREKLAFDLTELINELGPKIYPDFDAARIVQESKKASRSPSPSRPPSRPSSSLRLLSLTDLMDDKLFNWEKAEDSDYDDVFFFLDKHDGGKITGRSRSNSSSRRLSSGKDGASSSASLTRVNSFNSINSNLEAFTQLPKTNTISSFNVPEVRITDDDGYQGDKENSIQTKKNV
ncbi:bifunctional glycerol-3-phosphate/glycerone-phosphate O-acyltransferase SCT1 [Gigaspora margarita]|uniref:Bifunctional glycerol-3-phosphate/glycerone-phosphate O-acyltransferase SCT1 n=1 Tax=Gigaspora margarita TaxID=4874 RepID=A0A8H4A1J1_GIGMA|nr:bifunctional glycerol-3-phosphate/glycerone-phosphate O-acyltransferase SCT1 [Gigaspora margarita]